jgi:hypothetical protein
MKTGKNIFFYFCEISWAKVGGILWAEFQRNKPVLKAAQR